MAPAHDAPIAYMQRTRTYYQALGYGAPSLAAQRQDGQPLWHPLDGPHEYLRRLGGNTGYVIHHEEAMADNVALLVTGQRARNPELLARIKTALAASR